MINRFIFKIDFKVMGVDEVTSDFLNWCMQNRDNLEFIKDCNTLKKVSTQTVIHHDQTASIMIDDIVRHKKA